MKKVLKLSLIVLIIFMITIAFLEVNTYATLSCNIELQTNKNEFEKGEEFIVDFSISNIQSNRGVISLSTTLEYDKDSVELVKMEGQNGWETPIEGVSYNKENGKIVITRNGLGTIDEIILKMTFKLKEEAKQNQVITLKDVAIADGDEIAKFDSVKKEITIKVDNQQTGEEEKPNPGEDTNTGTNTKPNENTNTDSNENTNANSNGNTNSGTNTNTNQGNNITEDKTVADNATLPKTGNPSYIWIICIGVAALLIATYFFVKIKLINKKINR